MVFQTVYMNSPLALLRQQDIDHFGLSFCLKDPMAELKDLVENGLWDERTNKRIQIRVIACLGDNLGIVIYPKY